MTTKNIASIHAHSTDSSTEAAITTPEATGAPVAAAGSTIFIKPPPALTTIPSPPEGYQNTNGKDYVATLPKNLELAAMPAVLEELGRFGDYAPIFGKTAPPLEFVLQTATAAAQWSAMRAKSAAWDEYARSQEGATWSDFRTIMNALRPALALAVTTDATIARRYPALVRLFGAKSVIAQRGVATRAANKAAKAAGKPPVRGKLATKMRRLKSAAATLAAAGETLVLPTTSPVQIVAAGAAPGNGQGTAPVTVPTGAAANAPQGGAPTNGAVHA